MSAADVGRHFGINQSSASRWENDILLPGEDHIPRLAVWLGMDPDEIRGMKHNLTPPSVLLSQLTEAVNSLADRVEAIERRMDDEPTTEPPTSAAEPKRRTRKPRVEEFTSEAPPQN